VDTSPHPHLIGPRPRAESDQGWAEKVQMIARLRRTTESNKSFEQTPKASSVSNGRQLLWFNGFDSAAQLNSVLSCLDSRSKCNKLVTK
jgi:hypothetical protein